MTVYNLVEIRAPIWNGQLKKRCVGIADFRVRDFNKIVITYTRKDGTRTFPNSYAMRGADIQKYPLVPIPGSSVKVYTVPLEDLEVLDEEPIR